MQNNMKTLKNQISASGETVSTCLPEGSPVNRSRSQENAKEQRTAATCGPRCSVSFGLFARDGSLEKTFTALLIGRKGWSSTRCVLTWRRQDTRCSRTLYQLAVSALPTDGTDAGLLPTVQTQGLKRCEKGKTVFMPVNLLPTPTANDAANSTMPPSQINRDSLAGTIMRGTLPTPKANDYRSGMANRVGDESYSTAQRYDSIPGWENFPAQSPIRGRNDGFSGGLAGLSFPAWCRESIKACGNAIVPQVALQIFKTIEEYEKQ